ncbi:hypothetical protein ACFFR3_43740 [Nonomuraea salmonea]|uniref:WD40 repeat domain-containing protein n=1 Tax=Nonomuraea salmonea TaxID=46181 RepID=A0ABV5P1J7_9ACTN
MRTEDELIEARVTETLRMIADRAPQHDLLAGLAERRRRRRHRRARAVLAAACAITLGWGAAVTWPSPLRPVLSAHGPRTDGAGSYGSATDGSTRDGSATDGARTEGDRATGLPSGAGREIERVWPDAMVTIPAGYRPLAAIDATRLLVRHEPGQIGVYDVTTGRFGAVFTPPADMRALTVDEEHAAWLSGGWVWVAPLRGSGQARRAGRVQPGAAGEPDRLALAGDQVAWSSPLGGVWRLSLDGGRPERVPRSAGLQLAGWPWATDEPLALRDNPTRMVNLETGRKVTIRAAHGVEGLRCGPTWCVGTRGQDAVVQRVDGRDVRVRKGLREPGYRDRFFVGHQGVYDARADRLVSFAPLTQWSGGDGLIAWRQGDGLRVVNLAAVPPAR